MDSSYHWTDNFGDECPYTEEKRRGKDMKKLKEHHDMLQFVAAAEYGIPTRCPCGGDIKHDVSPTPKFQRDRDTLPGSRYFTCTKFKDDGLHFRHPWVFGVEEEISKVLRKVEEQSKTIEAQSKTIEEQSKTIEEMQNEIQNHALEIARLNMLL